MDIETIDLSSVTSNHVVVLKGFDRYEPKSKINELVSLVRTKIPKDTLILLVTSEIDLEILDEKQMNSKGWFRK